MRWLSLGLVGLTAALVGCGPVGGNPEAPAAASPPSKRAAPAAAKTAGAPAPSAAAEPKQLEKAKCPDWEPIDVGRVELEDPNEETLEQATAKVLEALDKGELIRATGLANAAWQRCLAAKNSATMANTTALGAALKRVRSEIDAPESGAEYVRQAQAHLSKGEKAQARAAWDHALLAYQRETKQTPVRAQLVDKPAAAMLSKLCAPKLRLDVTPKTTLSVQEFEGADLRSWKLVGTDGSVQFDGFAQFVEPVTDDAWLVFGGQVELRRAHGASVQLGQTSCGGTFTLIDDWLIATVAGKTHLLNLAHPERSFDMDAEPSDMAEASRVGPYIEVHDLTDDGVRTQLVFRPDIANPKAHAWTTKQLPTSGEVRLYYVPRWGGVLARRHSIPDKTSAMGFMWEIEATQLKTGKRLARVVMPPQVQPIPGVAIDKRYGLIAIGAPKDVRVAALGSGTVRKLAANEVNGESEAVAVTPDGMLCTDQVVMRRYYSCAMQITSDLRGGSRQRQKDRFCLSNQTSSWSSVIPPSPGHEHIGSEGATVKYAVCGQRLAPDGKRAAFLEVKPQKGTDAPFSGAQVRVIDTRTRRQLKQFKLEGDMERSFAFIDVSFSPDERYLAVLYNRRVNVYQLSDGARVGKDIPAEGWLGVVWLDSTTFSGGNEESGVAHLDSGAFKLQPKAAKAGGAPTDMGRQRCVFGEVVTPGQVCSSVPD